MRKAEYTTFYSNTEKICTLLTTTESDFTTTRSTLQDIFGFLLHLDALEAICSKQPKIPLTCSKKKKVLHRSTSDNDDSSIECKSRRKRIE